MYGRSIICSGKEGPRKCVERRGEGVCGRGETEFLLLAFFYVLAPFLEAGVFAGRGVEGGSFERRIVIILLMQVLVSRRRMDMLDFIGDFISGIVEPWITRTVRKFVCKFRKG